MRYPKIAVAVLALMAVCGFAGQVSAQPPQAVVAATAPIYVKPDGARTPLRTAAAGTRLTVVDEQEGWLQVQFSDPQFGNRTGWVRKDLVRVDDSRTTPMDLSVPPAPAAVPEPAEPPVTGRAPAPTQQWQPPTDKVAPVAPSRGGNRGWVDVNLGLAMSGADDALYSFNALLIDQASFYGKPSRGAEFDFGGGFMFTPKVGLGVSFTGTAHEDRAGLGAGIGNIVLASDATDELMRTEGAVNIQAMLVPFNSTNLRVRVFGGPSYFQYKADMVFDFDFNLAGGFVTDYDLLETEGKGWGAHIGVDTSYFFSRVVGVGGFARYSRAKVSVLEPMSEELQDITLGGFQTGGGLRLRF